MKCVCIECGKVFVEKSCDNGLFPGAKSDSPICPDCSKALAIGRLQRYEEHFANQESYTLDDLLRI